MAIATLILIFIGIFSVTSYFIFHLKRIKLYKAGAKFPGPRPLPFIGNGLLFVGDTEVIVKRVMGLLDIYPSPARAWMGSKLCIVLSDPEQMKTVFLSPNAVEKDDLFKFFRPWLGTGLFSAPASKWKIHRKIIMPTFNPRILESFVDIFFKKSLIMIKQMEVEISANEFDIFHYVALCTLDIVCETAMGVPAKFQTERYSIYVESAKTAFRLISLRILKVWLHPDFIFNLTKQGRELKDCITYLHKQTNEVIQKKKLQHSENNVDASTNKKAFLDLLMELSKDGKKLTDIELREEVDTMMIAGNDTTATVNSFVMFMLANFPSVQDKCYEELCKIYGDKINDLESVPTKCEDFSRMEYLERVIKETMRVFPVGPFLIRRVTEDIQIDEFTIPKDSTVIFAIMKLHRNPSIWKDPLKFDPDRFLPEEVNKRHPYSYVPFSAGARNCIGTRYAMMAMKVLIATVLRKYILKRDKLLEIKDIRIRADVIIKPVEQLNIKIERRSV